MCGVRLIQWVSTHRYDLSLYNRPPSSDTDIDAVAAVKDLINCLNKLCDVDCTVVIVGDFNFPNIDWSDPVLVSDSDRCSVGLLFAQFAQYAM